MLAILPPQRSQDVSIYVRHNPDCTKKKADDCGCPLWLYIKATQKRVSARTTSWAQAETEAQKIRDSYDPVKRELTELRRKREYGNIPLAAAIEKYLASKKSDKKAEMTLRAYGYALSGLSDFMHARGVTVLRDISPELMTDWKNQWPDKSPLSMATKRSQTRIFFGFCCKQRWIDRNENSSDALLGKIVGQGEAVPAVPFYEDQYQAILAAIPRYDQTVSPTRRGPTRIITAVQLHALIQLMRWSGLAILDAVSLERWRIDAEGVLKVRRTKTKTWVTVQLPIPLIEELRGLDCGDPKFFFWSPLEAKATSRAIAYGKALFNFWPLIAWPRPVVDGDGVPVQPHSHMFRHTFAYHWLQNGGDIRDLQILLGHKRLATTEGSYAGFMPEAGKLLLERQRAMLVTQNAPGTAKTALPPSPIQPQPVHRIRFRRRVGRL